VRRVPLPWLGSHVLYVEEYLYDEPFERRRLVLLSIEPPDAEGTLRVRQFTRRLDAAGAGELTADTVESSEGCDLWLKRDGEQFAAAPAITSAWKIAGTSRSGSIIAWRSVRTCSGTASERWSWPTTIRRGNRGLPARG
jgi:hypothetical protein